MATPERMTPVDDSRESQAETPLMTDDLLDDSDGITQNMLAEEERLHEERLKAESVPSAAPLSAAKFAKLEELLDKAQHFTAFIKNNIEAQSSDPALALASSPPTDSKKRKSPAKSASKKAVKSGNNSSPSVDDEIDPRQPTLVTGTKMFPHQLHGVEWLNALFANGINGILADEMGLGKTIQAISFIAYLMQLGVQGPFLVVAPLSTLTNWVREFHKFTPTINVLLYHGSKVERTELRRLNFSSKGMKCPVIVTSYEIMLIDRPHLDKFSWKYIVVDEGHRLKNKDCRLLREMKYLRSDGKVLLTGTPLQNNLMELWALLHFLLPTIFEDAETFLSWFNFDSVLGDEAAEKRLAQAEKDKQIVSKLHRILDPLILRRLKADVGLDIPDKREFLVYAGMSELQKTYYRLILARDKEGFRDQQMLVKGDGPSSPGDKQGSSFHNALMQLRKCCNHPYLFQLPEDPCGEPILDDGLVTQCGKMQLFEKMLNILLADNHKVLVFCQMTRMMDLIEDFLEHNNLKCCRIDGTVKMGDRQRLMDDFNSPTGDASVFLLSTRSGGLGINLCAADTVIIYDSDWNPQQDLQAQARCHRIGQQNEVNVYRLVTAGTVEVAILKAADGKRKLEQMVVHRKLFKTAGGSTDRQRVSEDELLALFAMDREALEKGEEERSIEDSELRQLLDRSITHKTGRGFQELKEEADLLF